MSEELDGGYFPATSLATGDCTVPFHLPPLPIPRRRPILIAGGAAVAFLLGWAAIRTGAGRPAGSGETEVWFGDLGPPEPITSTEARDIAGGIRGALAGGRVEDIRLSPRWDRDREPRIVLASVSDGRHRARVSLGAGRGLRAAIEQVVERAASEAGGEPAAPAWLRVDVVTRVGRRRTLRDGQRVPFDRSLTALASAGGERLAILPAEIVVFGLIDPTGRWRSSRLPRLKRAAALGAPEVSSWIPFETEAWFHDGGEVVRLYRGRRAESPVGPESLLDACRSGGDYLVRSLSEEGRFVYSWLPKSNRDRGGYNLVRHAGTTYALAEIHAATGDDRYLEAARRAARFLFAHVEPFGPREREMSVLVSDDRIKLGGVALAVVALAKIVETSGDRSRIAAMQSLARYLRDCQREDGSFVGQRFWPSGRERRDFVSEYYPGEALLALVRLHAIDGDETWLDVAERGARYLIQVRDRDVPTSRLLHDHWLLYALDGLRRVRPDHLWVEHSMRITQAITSRQNGRSGPRDWEGSWYDPPRSTPTATRCEGLLAALATARAHGLDEDARRIRRAIDLAARFQLRTQFRPESALYLADPARALGGFHRSLTNYEIRIDYVQHNVSALLAYRELLSSRSR